MKQAQTKSNRQLEARLKDLQSRIEQVAPRCDWSNSGMVDWTTQLDRNRYRELTAEASKIETELGW